MEIDVGSLVGLLGMAMIFVGTYWLCAIVHATFRKVKEQKRRRHEESKAAAELKDITPSNDQLLKLAEKYPPPPEWYEGPEEELFGAEEK